MSRGEQLTGRQAAAKATYYPTSLYELGHSTTNEPGAFPCVCGKAFPTATEFIVHKCDKREVACPGCGR